MRLVKLKEKSGEYDSEVVFEYDLFGATSVSDILNWLEVVTYGPFKMESYYAVPGPGGDIEDKDGYPVKLLVYVEDDGFWADERGSIASIIVTLLYKGVKMRLTVNCQNARVWLAGPNGKYRPASFAADKYLRERKD